MILFGHGRRPTDKNSSIVVRIENLGAESLVVDLEDSRIAISPAADPVPLKVKSELPAIVLPLESADVKLAAVEELKGPIGVPSLCPE